MCMIVIGVVCSLWTCDCVHDCDRCGVFPQDLRLCGEGDQDFSTAEDDEGKAVLLAIQEDKRKR